MKVAVVGSRGFRDFELMRATLDQLEIDEIISGGAAGADKLAEQYAALSDIPTTIFYPDWARNGRGAGFIRNINIIDAADRVVAFWNGFSKGTEHSINYARTKNKQVDIILYDQTR